MAAVGRVKNQTLEFSWLNCRDSRQLRGEKKFLGFSGLNCRDSRQLVKFLINSPREIELKQLLSCEVVSIRDTCISSLFLEMEFKAVSLQSNIETRENTWLQGQIHYMKPA